MTDRTTPDLKETLLHLAKDWKQKQNKSAFECGVDLERELDRFSSLSSPEARIFELERAVRNLLSAFEDECQLPTNGPKPLAMAEARRVVGVKI